MSSFYIIDLKKDLVNPMEDDLDMGENNIKNVKDPNDDGDCVNKKYVDSNAGGNNITGDLVLDGNLTFKKKGRIENLFEPDFASDAVTKKYVDDNFVNIDGSSTMTGKLNMGNNKISFVSSPSVNTDAATKLYVDIGDGGKLSIQTNSMAAKLNMANNRISNVGDPGNPEDCANKKYVDKKAGESLKRDGSNSMSQHLNMNNKRIFNLLAPGQRDHAVSKGHLDDYVQLELTPLRLSVIGSRSNDSKSYHQFWIQHPVQKKAGWHIGNQRQAATTNDNDLYFTVSYSTGTKKTVSYILDSKSLTDMNFTGQHRCVLDGKYQAASQGLIVSANGKYDNMFQKENSINDALPVVEISDIENDKRVFGVLSAIETERIHGHGSFHTVLEKPKGDDRVFVNGLGEGCVWVCNHNGALKNGDYICVFRKGIGQKQKTCFGIIRLERSHRIVIFLFLTQK